MEHLHRFLSQILLLLGKTLSNRTFLCSEADPFLPQIQSRTPSLEWCRRRSLKDAHTERLETLEMVAVYMTEKACERVVPPMNFSEVVNLFKVSDAGVKAFKEMNFECQEILLRLL